MKVSWIYNYLGYQNYNTKTVDSFRNVSPKFNTNFEYVDQIRFVECLDYQASIKMPTTDPYIYSLEQN